jgi:2-isopropylmalate synthase
VATTEMGLLAGADRVEATLFGNGERTGNVDMVTLAMNMYTQGVDPELNFSNINKIKEMFERCTKMPVGDRQPYAGKLVFTAFSGSHQDAINKGVQYMKTSGTEYWEIPYLPIDPADVGREYEPIIRINSQSGKGGAAYIMEHDFGFDLPKSMHPEFGHIVQVETDKVGKEVSPERINELFHQAYIDVKEPYQLLKHAFQETVDGEGHSHVAFAGTLRHTDTVFEVSGEGNGPIDAFFNAIQGEKISRFTFLDYASHAITDGSDSQGVAYILLQDQRTGKQYWGVGLSHNINLAPLRAILAAINRAKKA